MGKRWALAVSTLVMALGVSGLADAGQRDSRGRDRNGRESQGNAQPRTAPPQQNETAAQPRTQAQPRGGASDNSQARRGAGSAVRPSERSLGGNLQSVAPAPRAEQLSYAVPRPNTSAYGNSNRYVERNRYGYANGNHSHDNRHGYYGPPRLIPGVRAPRHYYGPGGNFSVYFGVGQGYLYGAPYAGRVYGYLGPPSYGAPIYYGDVRLLVRPLNAAVYVDGYYAGIVDDFDGVFQRLTLVVGPHQIELDAPGLAPQTYDVYVDPARTVTIRSDLYPY